MSEFSSIQRMFPSFIFKRGYEYFQQGRVHDLLYDINYHVWTAVVHGREEDYFVEINIEDSNDYGLHAYCDCPAFEIYGPCKHVAAVMLSIQERESKSNHSLASYQYQVTDNFIRALASIQHQESPAEILSKKVPLHIEYICHLSYDQKIVIELKAGPKRRYVVKNMQTFLEGVLNEQEYVFTKNFTYSPDIHYVLQQDRDIFEFLYDMIQNSKVYQQNQYSYQYGNSLDEKRYTIIPPLAIKTLFEKLIERNFTFKTNSGSIQQLKICFDHLPFQYSLSKNKQNELVFHVNDLSTVIYLKPYRCLFHEATFYFLAKDELPIVEQLMIYLRQGNELPIAKDQADAFISQVLPSLKKVGHVDITNDVASEIIQLPLIAKLFLEMKDTWIIGKLEYHYGRHVIDPFREVKEEEVIIIRDVEKEQQIMRLIEHADFHYNGNELYIEPDEEQLYDFLYHILPVLDEYVQLFLTADIRKMLIADQTSPRTNIRVESATNLLEIGFNIDGVDENDLQHILNAVIEKKRYYRMQSGELLSLEGEEFTSIGRLFSDMNIQKKDIQDGQIKMPVYRGMQIDQLIHTEKDYDTSFRKLLQHLKSPEEQIYELPDLQADLRNYQVTGFQWFKSLSEYHLGGILADDMGLGKTLQSIAYIASEKSDKPHLIIAPSSVVYNWKNECKKFAPSLSVTVLTGSPSEREQRIKDASTIDVWITSYGTVRQDIALYREQTFQTLILDEAQYIKNYATKTSKAIRELTASRKFALSGTPIENSIDELWAIFQVVLPGLMPDRKTFRQLEHEKIASLIRPFILRRLKTDVLKELPEKIESVYVAELTREQKELYLAYLQQVQQQTRTSLTENSFQQNRMKILAGLTRLRQICCHPSLFMENYEGTSGKLAQLMETVRTALEHGRRMLIFSQFTSMHEIIANMLEREEIDYFYLHGQTPSEDRVQMSERFNNGEKSVFLISLKAGGTGLNLTGADTVILYDLWWNPAVEDQATGRAHRFGQKNIVQVIRLIAEGTIEEKIYELQQKKRELIDRVIQPGETVLTSLSEKDIRELLSI